MMLKNMPISRKSFIASIVGFASIGLQPKVSKATTLDVQFSTPEEYIDAINEAGCGWTTYELDNSGSMIEVDHFQTLDLGELASSARGALGKIIKILIQIGKQIVGYVIGEVIDNIVVSVTGQSGGYWVGYAANQLLGRPVPSGNIYRLPCSVYPPNSGEYVRCVNS